MLPLRGLLFRSRFMTSHYIPLSNFVRLETIARLTAGGINREEGAKYNRLDRPIKSDDDSKGGEYEGIYSLFDTIIFIFVL